jgi:serine/threonine-protein kinase
MGFYVGQKFGDYSITATVDAGGMGQVYRVQHCLTKRTEAMKVLSAELATDIEIKRFEREMRALARLNHSNIAALHNAIHSENQLILLTEYIEGQTLESMFRAGRLPLETGVGYVKQILSALGYAHQQGVVHRDVTPANVVVTASGQVKLTDFGLSKSYGDALLTNCGEVLGSLPYLAPERLKGATQPDRRSDLYSAGAVLYEHLTGQKPFGANRRLAPVLTDSEGEPQAPSQIEPSLSPKWDEILRRALARDPMHRYQSADEFLDAIAQLDHPTDVTDLPLPQLRTLGIAIFAGLVVAIVAAQALTQFREAAPVTTQWGRLHIPPPSFATDKTPAGQQADLVTTPPVAKPANIQHLRYAARSTKISVLEPHQAVLASPKALTVPVPSNSPTPAPPISSAATAAPVAGAESVDQETPSDTADPSVPQAGTPAKRGFWSRLNVFKRKGADAKEKP